MFLASKLADTQLASDSRFAGARGVLLWNLLTTADPKGEHFTEYSQHGWPVLFFRIPLP